MPQTKTIKEDLLEMIAQFTDDYIDEWTNDGNELDRLHEISDDFNLSIRKSIADHILGLPSLQFNPMRSMEATWQNRKVEQIRQELSEALGVKVK